MNGMQHVGFKKNKDQLNQYLNVSDLAIHKPTKDQWDIGTEYEVANIQHNACQFHNNEEERGRAFQKKR